MGTPDEEELSRLCEAHREGNPWRGYASSDLNFIIRKFRGRVKRGYPARIGPLRDSLTQTAWIGYIAECEPQGTCPCRACSPDGKHGAGAPA